MYPCTKYYIPLHKDIASTYIASTLCKTGIILAPTTFKTTKNLTIRARAKPSYIIYLSTTAAEFGWFGRYFTLNTLFRITPSSLSLSLILDESRGLSYDSLLLQNSQNLFSPPLLHFNHLQLGSSLIPPSLAFSRLRISLPQMRSSLH